MIRRKKIKRGIFTFSRKGRVNGSKPNSRIVKVGRRELLVFKMGEHTVVYKGNDVMFNSAIEGIPYEKWLDKYKRSKGIIDSIWHCTSSCLTPFLSVVTYFL